MTKCPKCGSGDTENVKILNSSSLHCNNCGYDEAEELEGFIEGKKKKSRNVYRSGGGNRSANRKGK
ncbi:MAG: hypothetical protein AABY22_18395 [Nanoarchaeota archaeon]